MPLGMKGLRKSAQFLNEIVMKDEPGAAWRV